MNNNSNIKINLSEDFVKNNSRKIINLAKKIIIPIALKLLLKKQKHFAKSSEDFSENSKPYEINKLYSIKNFNFCYQKSKNCANPENILSNFQRLNGIKYNSEDFNSISNKNLENYNFCKKNCIYNNKSSEEHRVNLKNQSENIPISCNQDIKGEKRENFLSYKFNILNNGELKENFSINLLLNFTENNP